MATIRRSGERWQAVVRRKGHAPQSRCFTERKDAEAWARQTEVAIDRGVFVDLRSAEGTTLGEALKRYGEQVTPGKKGRDVEAVRIKQWLRSPLAKRSLASLKPSDFAAWRDARLRCVSPSTVRREVTMIGHLFRVAAADWGMAVSNPVAAIRLPKHAKGRERRPSAAELDAIVAATESAELPAWIRLAVETVMRRGELAALTWRSIDFDARVARLSDSKNGDRRDVPLSSAALLVLRDLPRRIDGRVFGMTPAAASRAFLRAVRRARARFELGGGTDADFCRDLHLHDLRHEGVSRLIERGFNLIEAASVSGHRDLRMLKRYSHLRAEDLARKLG